MATGKVGFGWAATVSQDQECVSSSSVGREGGRSGVDGTISTTLFCKMQPEATRCHRKPATNHCCREWWFNAQSSYLRQYLVMEKVGDGGFAIGVVSHTLFMLALLLLLTLVLTLTFSYSASLLSSFLCYLFSSDSEHFKATHGFATDWSRQLVGLQKVRGE